MNWKHLVPVILDLAVDWGKSGKFDTMTFEDMAFTLFIIISSVSSVQYLKSSNCFRYIIWETDQIIVISVEEKNLPQMVGNYTQRGSEYVPMKQGTTAPIDGRKNQNPKISEYRSKKKYSVSSNSPPCPLPSGNFSLVLRKKLGKIACNRGISRDFEAKQIRVWM